MKPFSNPRRTKITQLPDLPSELIRLALSDLRKVEEAKDRYIVNMQVWHDPVEGNCEVCLAGSVMAMTLDLPIEKVLIPEDLDREVANKLFALNHFRLGAISLGLFRLGIEFPKGLIGNVSIAQYDSDRKQFYLDMQNISNLLASKGL